jgi:hypothetical protein
MRIAQEESAGREHGAVGLSEYLELKTVTRYH